MELQAILVTWDFIPKVRLLTCPSYPFKVLLLYKCPITRVSAGGGSKMPGRPMLSFLHTQASIQTLT
eukprot:350339-Pelagomonas_calceolata.AAC.1